MSIQLVEKVAVELEAITNRAQNVPKVARLVPFGARSEVRATTIGVFQQPESFPEAR